MEWYNTTSWLLECTNYIGLENVFEYYIITINIVSSSILVYGSPGEVLNNDTLGFGFESNTNKWNNVNKKLSLRVKQGQFIISVVREGSVKTFHGLLIKLLWWWN